MFTINIINWFKIFLLNHFKDDLFDTNDEGTIKQVFDIAKKNFTKRTRFYTKRTYETRRIDFFNKIC